MSQIKINSLDFATLVDNADLRNESVVTAIVNTILDGEKFNYFPEKVESEKFLALYVDYCHHDFRFYPQSGELWEVRTNFAQPAEKLRKLALEKATLKRLEQVWAKVTSESERYFDDLTPFERARALAEMQQ